MNQVDERHTFYMNDCNYNPQFMYKISPTIKTKYIFLFELFYLLDMQNQIQNLLI